jgi:hypothetical protein
LLPTQTAEKENLLDVNDADVITPCGNDLVG